jgi:hypothetical protein
MNRIIRYAIPLCTSIAIGLLMHRVSERKAMRSRIADRMVEDDREVLAQLHESGADLRRPLPITFTMVFRRERDATRAAEQASLPGMRAVVLAVPNQNAWLCDVSGELVPTEAVIRDIGMRLNGIAESNAGTYDGWEAALDG